MSYQMQTLPGINLHGEPEKTGVYDQQEIVTLLTQYYELLAKMRYFPSSYIKYAPHNPPIDVELAKTYNLEPQVIELLQVLPYVEGYSNEDEFILGGSFADMRNPDVLTQSRDPGYCSPEGGFDDENGEYVRPWELCINECGNHGTMMFLDTRNGHITMAGQDSGRCEDPDLHGFPEHSEGPNSNSHAHLPSRHARELFEDCSNRLMKLEWIPSSEDRRMIREWDEYEDLKLLFRTYGWPHNFDSTGFDSAYTRWREFCSIKQQAFDSASNIIEATHSLSRATGALEWHSRRRIRRVRDRGSDTEPGETEDSDIEWNEKLEAVRDESNVLERAIARHGSWKGERAEMVKTWKKHFEDAIEREDGNLMWWNGDGKKYRKQEEVEETEEKIRVLKERLMNVEGQPMTPEEAIRHL